MRKKQSSRGPASPASAEPDSEADSPKQLQKQGSGSSSPEGNAREPSTAAAKNRPAGRAKTSSALSTDDSEQPEAQRAESAAESDEDAESPVAVLLKSRKLSKVGDSSAERGKGQSPMPFPGLLTIWQLMIALNLLGRCARFQLNAASASDIHEVACYSPPMGLCRCA